MLTALLFSAALATASGFRGVVFLRRDGVPDEPVPAAVLDLTRDHDERRAVTATDGSFVFDDLPPGEWNIEISSSFSPVFGRIEVTSSTIPRSFFIFEGECWAGYGRVSDASTGEPVAQASVHYLGDSVTDANGDYFVDWGCSTNPATGPFRFHNTFFIWVTAPGYRQAYIGGGRAESIDGPRILDIPLAARDKPDRFPVRSRPLP